MARADRHGCAQGRTLNDTDTIAAVSSGPPPAAIAIIRISGANAMRAATALAGPLPPPRRAALRPLRDAAGGLLDRALVLSFPGPASATGEDLVELHCHGGRAVVAAVEAALLRSSLVRRAEPGEFTRRALLNGRIDLNEAEGLADLLEAETDDERRNALATAEGHVTRLVRGWSDELTDLAARLEASIDYADEDDVAATIDDLDTIRSDQTRLVDAMRQTFAAPSVERWRDGITVVVAGPPNAGKSTLVNALAGRDAAIVSPMAGTTRDRVEVAVRRNAVGYVFVDTAGLRDDTADPIEAIGIKRAKASITSADIVVWLDDAPAPPGAIVVHAKADLGGQPAPATTIVVSAADGTGLQVLWAEIERRADGLLGSPGVRLHERLRQAMSAAADYLATPDRDLLVWAEQLRCARRALAPGTTQQHTDAVLDALFSRFCVGK